MGRGRSFFAFPQLSNAHCFSAPEIGEEFGEPVLHAFVAAINQVPQVVASEAKCS